MIQWMMRPYYFFYPKSEELTLEEQLAVHGEATGITVIAGILMGFGLYDCVYNSTIELYRLNDWQGPETYFAHFMVKVEWVMSTALTALFAALFVRECQIIPALFVKAQEPGLMYGRLLFLAVTGLTVVFGTTQATTQKGAFVMLLSILFFMFSLIHEINKQKLLLLIEIEKFRLENDS